MIIYNITVKVEWTIADEWRSWMLETHIRDILNTGCFEKHQFVRLLQIDEIEGPTYAIQYYATALSKYDYYLQHYASHFNAQIKEKWGDRCVYFQTLMQTIE